MSTEGYLPGYAALDEYYTRAGSNAQAVINYGSYSLIRSADFWIADKNGPKEGHTGWKFHVSVDPSQLDQAWGIASNYLASQGVGQFKVANPKTRDAFADPNGAQSGKMLTIYEFSSGPDMRGVMQGLENQLAHAGIRPGPQVRNDRPVPGSHYSSYRNDQVDVEYVRQHGSDVFVNPDNPYLSNKNLEKMKAEGFDPQKLYNLSGKADPFADFSIQNPAQMRQQQDLRFMADALGSVASASVNPDGSYALGVSPYTSRQLLVDQGVDPAGIQRKVTHGNHVIHVRPEALPQRNAYHQLPGDAQQQVAQMRDSMHSLRAQTNQAAQAPAAAHHGQQSGNFPPRPDNQSMQRGGR